MSESGALGLRFSLRLIENKDGEIKRVIYSMQMLRSFFAPTRASDKYNQTLTLEIAGEQVDLSIRHNARAKRYTLRMPQKGNEPVLTIPKHGTYDEAHDFALRNIEWLADRISNRSPVTAFEAGAIIPFRGEKCRLQASGALRGRVQCVAGDDNMNTLLVPGDNQHFERRLTDWLKKQAREDITKACHHHANNLGLHYRSIAIRDQRTRWGSCSSGGRLNFSWRLILAPKEVLDYVAAHEVAHLEEMNHQPQFWRLVEKTCPNMQEHRNWLRNNGHELHQYGS